MSPILKGYTMTDEIATPDARAALRQADSFEEVLALAGGAENVTNIGDVVGDGFSLLKDKDKLLKVSFIIVDFRENIDEDSKRPFFSVYVITKHGEKFIFNDGGTGIADQCRQMLDTSVQPPIYVTGGLRRSDYMVEDVGDATTYYLDTSKIA